jgi:hypothetical protein
MRFLRIFATIALLLASVATTAATGADEAQWRQDLMKAPLPTSEQDLEPPSGPLAAPGASVVVPRRDAALLDGLVVTGASTRTVVRGTGAFYSYSLLEMSADGIDGMIQLKTSDSDNDFRLGGDALSLGGCQATAQYCASTEPDGTVHEAFLGLRAGRNPVSVYHIVADTGQSWGIIGYSSELGMLGTTFDFTLTGDIAGRVGDAPPSASNVHFASALLELAEGLHTVSIL